MASKNDPLTKQDDLYDAYRVAQVKYNDAEYRRRDLETELRHLRSDADRKKQELSNALVALTKHLIETTGTDKVQLTPLAQCEEIMKS